MHAQYVIENLYTVESGYLAHALNGITVKEYVLYNKVRHRRGSKVDHASKRLSLTIDSAAMVRSESVYKL